MLKTYKYIFSSFLLILTLSSCEDFFETNIEIDPPKYEKKLAIVGKAKAGDSIIILNISESIGVLEQDSLMKGKSGVLVNASINGIKSNVKEIQVETYDGSFNQQKTIYAPRYIIEIPQGLKPGDLVKIEAKYGSLPVAKVETKVPIKPTVSNQVLTKEAGKNIDSEDISKLTFDYNISDPNIYLIGYSGIQSIYCSSSTTINGVYTCNKMDTLVYSTLISFQDPDAAKGYYLKKKNEDLSPKKLTLTFSRSLFDIKKVNNNEKPFITLNNYNLDGYQYLLSLSSLYDADDNPFATPVNVKSNITGGLGILLLSYETRLEL